MRNGLDRLCLARTIACLLLPAALVACGGGGGGGGGGAGGAGTSGSAGGVTSAPPTAPSIAYFNSTPTAVSAGGNAQLSWSVSGATSISIDSGIGAVTGATASLSVSPAATLTYHLTASNAIGHSSASTTVTVGSTVAHYGTMTDADTGGGANTNGDIPFPATNAINTDISQATVDPNSSALIESIGLTTGLHPDFGPFPYGIPFVIVDQTQPFITVTINPGTGYPGDSDIAPMPIPSTAPIEGGPNSGGDSHVLVVDRANSKLYELWHGELAGDGTDWTADQSSIFDLTSNNWRPTKAGQCDVTSADAAGLPIFPLLVRYEEVESGVIAHAMRMTVQKSRKAYVPPASHWASSDASVNRPPMGMRVRLKAGYTIPANFSKESTVMLQAMKTYGLIVADNGSNWYITGATDPRWPIDTMVSELRQVPGSAFEVVTMTGLVSTCS